MRPTVLATRTGCPQCARERAHEPRVSETEWDRRADSVGCEWVETPKYQRVKALIRCKQCRHEWLVAPGSIQQGTSCPRCSKHAPVTQQEWDRRAAAAGLRWCEPVTSARAKRKAECAECGHTWAIAPYHVKNGTGCPVCAGRLPLSDDELDSRAFAVGLGWVERPRGANVPVDAICLDCGRVSKHTPNNVSSGKGCAACAGILPLTQEEWDKRAAAVGIRWLEPVASGKTKTRAECTECGNRWKKTPSEVSVGTGCPACATNGFDPTRPSLVYLLVYAPTSLMKVGIAARDGVRLDVHRGRGWEVFATWDQPDGYAALRIERAVLNWWEDRGAPFASREEVPGEKGWTEVVHIGRVDVPDTANFIDDLV